MCEKPGFFETDQTTQWRPWMSCKADRLPRDRTSIHPNRLQASIDDVNCSGNRQRISIWNWTSIANSPTALQLQYTTRLPATYMMLGAKFKTCLFVSCAGGFFAKTCSSRMALRVMHSDVVLILFVHALRCTVTAKVNLNPDNIIGIFSINLL